jgi:hypothetical protein
MKFIIFQPIIFKKKKLKFNKLNYIIKINIYFIYLLTWVFELACVYLN